MSGRHCCRPTWPSYGTDGAAETLRMPQADVSDPFSPPTGQFPWEICRKQWLDTHLRMRGYTHQIAHCMRKISTKQWMESYTPLVLVDKPGYFWDKKGEILSEARRSVGPKYFDPIMIRLAAKRKNDILIKLDILNSKINLSILTNSIAFFQLSGLYINLWI